MWPTSRAKCFPDPQQYGIEMETMTLSRRNEEKMKMTQRRRLQISLRDRIRTTEIWRRTGVTRSEEGVGCWRQTEVARNLQEWGI